MFSWLGCTNLLCLSVHGYHSSEFHFGTHREVGVALLLLRSTYRLLTRGWLVCHRSYIPVEGRENSWCMLSDAPGMGSWCCLHG